MAISLLLNFMTFQEFCAGQHHSQSAWVSFCRPEYQRVRITSVRESCFPNQAAPANCVRSNEPGDSEADVPVQDQLDPEKILLFILSHFPFGFRNEVLSPLSAIANILSTCAKRESHSQGAPFILDMLAEV
jgi:hypothetical protein